MENIGYVSIVMTQLDSPHLQDFKSVFFFSFLDHYLICYEIFNILNLAQVFWPLLENFFCLLFLPDMLSLPYLLLLLRLPLISSPSPALQVRCFLMAAPNLCLPTLLLFIITITCTVSSPLSLTRWWPPLFFTITYTPGEVSGLLMTMAAPLLFTITCTPGAVSSLLSNSQDNGHPYLNTIICPAGEVSVLSTSQDDGCPFSSGWLKVRL